VGEFTGAAATEDFRSAFSLGSGRVLDTHSGRATCGEASPDMWVGGSAVSYVDTLGRSGVGVTR